MSSWTFNLSRPGELCVKMNSWRTHSWVCEVTQTLNGRYATRLGQLEKTTTAAGKAITAEELFVDADADGNGRSPYTLSSAHIISLFENFGPASDCHGQRLRYQGLGQY
eukprot:SAG31_NODE_3429_length_4284_cov_7.544086_7_plen_109_part_00